MSTTYTIGDIIDVVIQKIVPRGLGLAFAENLTVFVPLSAPGDSVRVRLTEVKKRMAFAEIVEIITGGPERIVPPCPHFGVCGGCDFQQLAYGAQLEAKVGIIRDCLTRLGKIDYGAEIPIIASPRDFAYRSRARWHIDPEKRHLGYYARDSHDVIDVQVCPILTPELEATLHRTRENLNWENVWGDRAEIEAAAGGDGDISLHSADMPEATKDLTFESGGFNYRFSSETFFQANQFLIPDLVNAALGDVSGDYAYDLYCGVGLFTLPLATRFARVTAVEGNTKSIAFAKQNAADAGQTNIKFASDGVGRFLAATRGARPDFILIDPPRSGTEKHTIPAIAALKPAQISYVSCEPSILARDLRILLDAGYRINSITSIDLFPQTHHVETVVRLNRK